MDFDACGILIVGHSLHQLTPALVCPIGYFVGVGKTTEWTQVSNLKSGLNGGVRVVIGYLEMWAPYPIDDTQPSSLLGDYRINCSIV